MFMLVFDEIFGIIIVISQDLTPKSGFRKLNPLISGKSRLVKYGNQPFSWSPIFLGASVQDWQRQWSDGQKLWSLDFNYLKVQIDGTDIL